MMANVIWKTKNSNSGMLPVIQRLSTVTPLRKDLDRPPIKGLLAVKAKL